MHDHSPLSPLLGAAELSALALTMGGYVVSRRLTAGGPRSGRRALKRIFALEVVLWLVCALLAAWIALHASDAGDAACHIVITVIGVVNARSAHKQWVKLDDDDDEPGALSKLRDRLAALVRAPVTAA
jgi:hypothetical protein